MTSSRMRPFWPRWRSPPRSAGCKERKDPGFQGWVEADMIFVSPDESGRVTKLNVREGEEVKPGEAALFASTTICSRPISTRTRLRSPTPNRPMIAPPSLSKTGSGTQANLDSADLVAARGRSAASIPRRPGWRGAAALRRSAAPSSRSISAKARWCRRSGRCCRSCRPATSSYASSCLRPELPKLAIGDQVRVTCDNCAADLTAKIYFIATTAEYTPPVIYSLDERSKLVYLIQARPSRPDALACRPADQRVPQSPETPVAAKR